MSSFYLRATGQVVTTEATVAQQMVYVTAGHLVDVHEGRVLEDQAILIQDVKGGRVVKNELE